MIKDLKIDDVVFLDCYTSMGASSAGERKIKDVKTKFDENTGEPFLIYKVDGEWYDSRNGGCYSNKNWMYYIESL